MTLEEAIQHLGSALEEVRRAALFDDKTPLLNALALSRALKDVGASSEPQVLIFGDLNGFKDINNKYTHAGGDAALAVAGRVLKVAVEGHGATAFRQSGDEFAVLCPLAAITAVQDSLETAFRSIVVEFNAQKFEVRMSFGWTKAEQAESSVIWKERAEVACDIAKQRGPGVCIEWTAALVVSDKEERRRCVCGCEFRAMHESLAPEAVLFCPRCGQKTGAEVQRP